MTPIAAIAAHPACAEFKLLELQAQVDCLKAYIYCLFPIPLPPEALRAALMPDSEHSADAI
ncbi:hypothetical protein CLU84_2401 [Comamonas sp. 26]|nr:hypothetical protein CLU84_2401 [Comamonas sp. 26]